MNWDQVVYLVTAKACGCIEMHTLSRSSPASNIPERTGLSAERLDVGRDECPLGDATTCAQHKDSIGRQAVDSGLLHK